MVLRQKKSAVVNATAASPGDGGESVIGTPYYRPTVRYPLPHNSMVSYFSWGCRYPLIFPVTIDFVPIFASSFLAWRRIACGSMR